MKILVAFFSASGITKELANTLAEVAGAELFKIRAQRFYTKEDLD